MMTSGRKATGRNGEILGSRSSVSERSPKLTTMATRVARMSYTNRCRPRGTKSRIDRLRCADRGAALDLGAERSWQANGPPQDRSRRLGQDPQVQAGRAAAQVGGVNE